MTLRVLLRRSLLLLFNFFMWYGWVVTAHDISVKMDLEF
jgi:hypothetical protein